MTPTHQRGSLLKELDLDKREVLALLDLDRALKLAKAQGDEPQRLVGRSIALIFEKASTRTRCAFEVTAHDQGAHVTYIKAVMVSALGSGG